MKNLSLLPALVVGLGFLTATTDCLHAAIFTVTTANISGPGSLPVAIAQANATAGENQINVSVAGPITLGLQLPTVTNSVAIIGVAATPTVISGGGTLPLFTFAAGTTNSLSNLVLANGYTTGSGAAIINAGILSVSGCMITNNFAGFGGAVSNNGTMMIANTVFQNNRAKNGGALFSSGNMIISHCQLLQNQAASGGAVYNTGTLGLISLIFSNNVAINGEGQGGGIFSYGSLTISASVFVTNSAIGNSSSTGGNPAFGGAIASNGGSLGITNSTFFNNWAVGGNGGSGQAGAGLGGAIIVGSGNCSLISCTIVSNRSVTGSGGSPNYDGIVGGICNNGNAIFNLLNTVIAGNTSSVNPDLDGIFLSNGYNLIGNNQGASGLSIFDFQNVSANLGNLQDNGGSTLTCAPLPGSYAIGYGTGVGAPTTDQRGVPRPQNGAYDIGAVQTVTNSPVFIGAAMVGGSGFSLNPIFDATNSYRLQASTNLTAWIDLTTNKNGGSLYFTDTAATNLPRRFYRTVKP
jgi:hypothetical protein